MAGSVSSAEYGQKLKTKSEKNTLEIADKFQLESAKSRTSVETAIANSLGICSTLRTRFSKGSNVKSR